MSKTRSLDNGIYVIDLGYRNETPVALVERTAGEYSEYIIGFNYEIKDNKMNWGYGYYYGKDLSKAKNDFNKVLQGGNLADTFVEKTPEQPEYYSSLEIMELIKSNEEIIYVQDEMSSAIIRVKDIPDFIVDINRRFGETDFEFANLDSFYNIGNVRCFESIITTKGEQLDEVDPAIKEKIIDRLVMLQKGECQPNKFKLIDVDMYKKIKEITERKNTNRKKERGAR